MINDFDDDDDGEFEDVEGIEEGDIVFIGPGVAIGRASPTVENIAEKSRSSSPTFEQWTEAGGGRFFPVGKTRGKLPAAVYQPCVTSDALGFEILPTNSDEIYQLPDMSTETVLKEINTFWNNEDRYRKHNLLYKRGVLMVGPPGAGKTVTIKLLIKEIIARDGIVLYGGNVKATSIILKYLRLIEPNRKIIIVLEDIDEIIRSNSEADVLSLLDGEHNIDNVLNVATTNYKDQLPARIINRPSRFDRVIEIPYPSEDARREYLRMTTSNGLDPETLQKWVNDTRDFSIAHLRELVAAVYCLDQPYGEVIVRLKEMAKQPTSDSSSGFKKRKFGFGG